MDKMVEKVARAIWAVRREEEDRCDMELEDIGAGHSVWVEARHAIKAMRMVPASAWKALGYGPDMSKAWKEAIDAALV